jgi:predicted CopG family antitoxin
MAQVRLDDDTRDKLRAMKEGNETYEEVVTRLIESYE